MKFKVIIAIVNPEKTDKVISAAREAGATGDVVMTGRGSGSKGSKSFLGLSILDQTEVIMFLVLEQFVDAILKAIETTGQLQIPGNGIAFEMDVEKVVGVESQLARIQEKSKGSS
jgi:nitrogen regulatory protein PII